MLKLLLSLTLILTACGEVKFEASSTNGSACATCVNPPAPPTFHPAHDDFTTPASNEVDIIFVVDNSRSMRAEQTQLSTRLNDFTDKIVNLDWRIAITSSDVTSPGTNPNIGPNVKQGHLQRFNLSGNPLFITKDTPNYSTVFENHVVLGDTGDGNEQGVNATRYVVERNEANWLRPNAQLATVLISDEDECSNQDRSCMGERNNPENLISKISSLYGSQKNFSFHSIVVADEACRAAQGSQIWNGSLIKAWIGRTYLELTGLTGGITGDICAQTKSYTEQLNDMGNLITNYSSSFSLQCAPHNGVIDARYAGGAPLPSHLSGSRVIFDVVVPPGTALTFDYECQD